MMWCYPSRFTKIFNSEAIQKEVARRVEILFQLNLFNSQKNFSPRSKNLLSNIFYNSDIKFYKYILNNFTYTKNKFFRIFLDLMTIKTMEPSHNSILYILHADSNAIFAGGTERHVFSLKEKLIKQNFIICELYKQNVNEFIFRTTIASGIVIEELIVEKELSLFITALSNLIQCLHVHHISGWNQKILRVLSDTRWQVKLASIHDYYFICPSIHLIKNSKTGDFCEVEKNLCKCNNCLKSIHRYKNNSIQMYRSQTNVFFSSVDHIIFPSDSVVKYYASALDAHWFGIENKVRILPHDLSHLIAFKEKNNKVTPIISSDDKNRIVFIGALTDLKGGEIALNSAEYLQSKGYTIEVWGGVFVKNKTTNISIIPYVDYNELSVLFETRKPKAVILPSLCGETFSFVFYETMLLSHDAVCIVGKYGNPADQIKKTGAGLVLEHNTVMGIQKSVIEMEKNRSKILLAKRKYVNDLILSYRDYFDVYLSFLPKKSVNHNRTEHNRIFNIDYIEIFICILRCAINEKRNSNYCLAEKISYILKRIVLFSKKLLKIFYIPFKIISKIKFYLHPRDRL